MKENKQNSEKSTVIVDRAEHPAEIVYTLDDIMSDRFARYAKYIIQDRALPDARDGLKPVQRRILYAMNELHLTFDTSYKKAARVVGEVIGKYHPHGDTSVYEALVRLSQTWKVRYPLIDMHGNNGSIDGDSPAAMRYTETRLSELSSYLLQDLEKETIPYAPNFDDCEHEPVVLPAMFPNLLVNGATGIAAGYATNMPPHNLCEVIDATIYRIKHTKCKIEDLFKIIHGPDFPTGGTIQGVDGIHEAYRTGKGRIILRSKMEEEQGKLVISEIPYEVVKQDLVKKLDDVRYNQPGLNIREVRDETDRTGLRIVVEVAKEANLEVIRKYLLKNTNLQVSYNFNMVSIINKQPKQTGLLILIDAYIAHQQDVVTRRSRYELNKAKNRLEVVEGLIKAISILDEIIAIIRHSKDRSDAIKNLVTRFAFTELQAEAIVQLRLYRLTSTDINLLMKEQDELRKWIAELQAILDSHDVLNKTIISQLTMIKNKFGDERRSVIEDEIETIEIEKVETVISKDVHIWVSRDGYLRSVDVNSSAKDTIAEFKHKPGDVFVGDAITSTVNSLMLVTSKGNYVIVPVYKIKQTKSRDIGEHVNTIAQLPGNEKIIGCFVLDDFDKPNCFLFVASKYGYFKKTNVKEFEASRISRAMTAMKLRGDDDELVCAQLLRNEDGVVLVSKQGFLAKYDVKDIDELGIKAVGLKSMNLRDDDCVIAAGLCHAQGDQLILFSDNNSVKKVKLIDLPVSSRPVRGTSILNNTRKAIAHLLFAFALSGERSNLSYSTKNDEINELHTRMIETSSIDTAFESFDMSQICDIVQPWAYDLTKIASKKIVTKDTNGGNKPDGAAGASYKQDDSKAKSSKQPTPKPSDAKKTKQEVADKHQPTAGEDLKTSSAKATSNNATKESNVLKKPAKVKPPEDSVHSEQLSIVDDLPNDQETVGPVKLLKKSNRAKLPVKHNKIIEQNDLFSAFDEQSQKTDYVKNAEQSFEVEGGAPLLFANGEEVNSIGADGKINFAHDNEHENDPDDDLVFENTVLTETMSKENVNLFEEQLDVTEKNQEDKKDLHMASFEKQLVFGNLTDELSNLKLSAKSSKEQSAETYNGKKVKKSVTEKTIEMVTNEVFSSDNMIFKTENEFESEFVKAEAQNDEINERDTYAPSEDKIIEKKETLVADENYASNQALVLEKDDISSESNQFDHDLIDDVPEAEYLMQDKLNGGFDYNTANALQEAGGDFGQPDDDWSDNTIKDDFPIIIVDAEPLAQETQDNQADHFESTDLTLLSVDSDDTEFKLDSVYEINDTLNHLGQTENDRSDETVNNDSPIIVVDAEPLSEGNQADTIDGENTSFAPQNDDSDLLDSSNKQFINDVDAEVSSVFDSKSIENFEPKVLDENAKGLMDDNFDIHQIDDLLVEISTESKRPIISDAIFFKENQDNNNLDEDFGSVLPKGELDNEPKKHVHVSSLPPEKKALFDLIENKVPKNDTNDKK